MSLRVASYNPREALGDESRFEGVVDFTKALDPDVAVFHSAFWTQVDGETPRDGETAAVLEESVRRLGKLGYAVTVAGEKDSTNRPDKTGFVGIVREGLGTGGVKVARFRQGFMATVTDPETKAALRIGGRHMPDTDETHRLGELCDLFPDYENVRRGGHCIRTIDYNPGVLLNDDNAMHGESKIARTLRLIRPLTDRVPDYADRDFNGATGLDKLRGAAHLLQSLAWMADGKTMEWLGLMGFKDADPERQPTVHLGRWGVAQLDHILYNSRNVHASGHRVHREVGGSDHWPISATVTPVVSADGWYVGESVSKL